MHRVWALLRTCRSQSHPGCEIWAARCNGHHCTAAIPHKYSGSLNARREIQRAPEYRTCSCKSELRSAVAATQVAGSRTALRESQTGAVQHCNLATLPLVNNKLAFKTERGRHRKVRTKRRGRGRREAQD